MLYPIITKEELVEVKEKLMVRDDWHEPDEQNVEVDVHGSVFDNAGIWGLNTEAPYSIVEKFVVLKKDGEPIAEVNLATLFAWATASTPKKVWDFPDFWSNDLVIDQVREITGIDHTNLDEHVNHVGHETVVFTVGGSTYILAKQETKLVLTTSNKNWDIKYLSYEEALEIIKEVLAEEIVKANNRCDINLNQIYETLDENGLGVPDADDLFTQVMGNSGKIQHINFYDVAEQLRLDPDRILQDAVIEGVRDSDDEVIMSVLEDYFDVGADDVFTDVVHSETDAKALAAVAKDFDLDKDYADAIRVLQEGR